MAVDNKLYNVPGDIWWDESQPLNSLRTAVNPARVTYMQRVISREHIDPRGKRALDIGCGGGILAEEAARLGFSVTGVDPSEPSLATARRHASTSGLAIDYVPGTGEALPFPDASFDFAYCCDVLEHVENVEQVLRETARVLKPGASFMYDTINRTFASKLVMIKLFQEWSATAWMPPHLHGWAHFIKPVELEALLDRTDFENVGIEGMKPTANPMQMYLTLRKLRKGEITPAEMGRRMPMALSRDRSVLFVGHAIRR